MTWLASKLMQRVQILIPSLVPNDAGGSDLVFGAPLSDAFDSGEYNQLAPVLTVWMGMKPIGFKGSGAKYIRGEQVNEAVTHEFIVRHIAVSSLGKEFSLGFSEEFKYMPNLMGLKSDYFLMVQCGSGSKGRLFRIHDVVDSKERHEYLRIAAEEIEERGVGWPS